MAIQISKNCDSTYFAKNVLSIMIRVIFISISIFISTLYDWCIYLSKVTKSVWSTFKSTSCNFERLLHQKIKDGLYLIYSFKNLNVYVGFMPNKNKVSKEWCKLCLNLLRLQKMHYIIFQTFVSPTKKIQWYPFSSCTVFILWKTRNNHVMKYL